MKIRRTLATAVVAAVITPVVLLSVTPALADAKPSAASQAQQDAQDKPSIEELEKAAEKARKVYEDAVAAEKTAKAVLDAALSDDAPLAVAAKAARKDAADAATAKTNADKALADAKAVLAALPETATDEEKANAEKAVTDAEAVALAAGDAKTAADAKAATAGKAVDDARVAAARAYYKAQKAKDEALKAKNAADKALADAKEEAEEEEEGGPDCVYEGELSTVVNGLPSKIVAGSTTDFSVRVTNGTDRTMGEVSPFVYFHATDKSGYNVIDEAFHLQWSTAASPTWKKVEEEEYAGSISPLKAGAHADVKLRLKVDAKAPAGDGLAFVAGDYFNDDESCGGNFLTEYAFDLLAAGSAVGEVGDAGPGKTTPRTPNTKPQGGTSSTPVSSGTPAATGSLANTGSSSALPQFAAAAGAAVALGAGAVFVVRRRKAGSAS
ncbi:LAETG motif-containing sortase-dependent surface protein [Streptomyces sp. NPDC088400]|uniref:LAETG motif-containing sortase-dependent surface protein n=1 Tax=Streptomyces sp. NPDC088400 TaxID=3365861 RepID=UPI0037FC7AB6